MAGDDFDECLSPLTRALTDYGCCYSLSLYIIDIVKCNHAMTFLQNVVHKKYIGEILSTLHKNYGLLHERITALYAKWKSKYMHNLRPKQMAGISSSITVGQR